MVVAFALISLGIAEFATRLREPWPLLFWLPTLWGGAALVLLGVFRMRTRPRIALILVVAGALVGFLPSAWTIVMPLLSVALVVLTARNFARREQLGAAGN